MKKNGDYVQQGHTADMIHNFDKIVSYVSQYFSLNIGDVIFTGTPKGVGECVVGDELEGFLGDESMFKLMVQ
jgi:2-keto-4-pentenoate hydratase/2-oxohepta-3-ene-1,7-dioic acid hydratase in catechol pathway